MGVCGGVTPPVSEKPENSGKIWFDNVGESHFWVIVYI